MGNQIEFKNFDQEFFEEEYEHILLLVSQSIEWLVEGDSEGLHRLFKFGMQQITLKIVNGETDRTELSRCFKLAMQGIYGHIKSLDNNGELTKLWVADQEVQLTNTGAGYDSVFELASAYTYASICRCSDVIDLIFNLPESSKFLNYGEHDNHPVYKLYQLFKSEPDIDKELFNDYIENSRGKYGGDPELKNYVSLIDEPRQKLLEQYYFGDSSSFNKQLKEALEKDKQYRDTTEGNRFRDVDGWLPWGLISFACRAHDKGWEITVEDSRLPMYLVKGECKVESLAP
ncbi:immunity 49 family protein [Fulvivirga sp. 29W222]|uniref:Immunity 49 family protein n=1 Tax=Fulvivirga marina TaxID=2494733 RepID=A0A937FUH2_9BACT|nr:immunity 49 family protein [Fulvivirga marina]MBL6445147.1 immunity 49 family protein [Fulvivirga marina]